MPSRAHLRSGLLWLLKFVFDYCSPGFSLSRITTPEQSVALLDFKASKEAVQDPELASYQVVHFAPHGLIDQTHPERSGLVLSLYDQQGRPIDGFLGLNEIFNLRLPARLVVLSACQSGQGKFVKGEGLLALTRGFTRAQGMPMRPQRRRHTSWRIGYAWP